VQAGLYITAVIGVLTSVVGAYYYLRIIKVMYFDEPVAAFDKVTDDGMSAILVGTSLFTLLFFVVPSPILTYAATAAAALFAG
jgi:NADH-quinone oxidoreductase subunit N